MNEKAKKWIRALRTTKRKQCHTSLWREGQCCALGLAAKNVLGMRVDEIHGIESHKEIVNELGLLSSGVVVTLNDRLGLTFPQIADELEKNPEKFFV